MKYKKILSILLSALLCFNLVTTGCKKQAAIDTSTVTTTILSGENLIKAEDYDIGYDETISKSITFNGTSIEADSSSCEVDGTTVKITAGGTYHLSGTLNDGQVIINLKNESDSVHLIFDNVQISNSNSACLVTKDASKVTITLQKSTENYLINEGTFETDDDSKIDAVLYAKTDLTINGEGCLSITSAEGHGIHCKDNLVITGGNYDISCLNQGIKANDSISIASGDFTIVSGKDGIHCENNDDTTIGNIYIMDGSFDIKSAADGISAQASLQIDDGTFNILGGDGATGTVSDSFGDVGNPFFQNNSYNPSADDSESLKCLKSGIDIQINNGIFYLNSSDDAIHSNNNLSITDGSFNITTDDDAIHAENDLLISGGTIQIESCYEGIEGAKITISDGDITLLASDDGINAASSTSNASNPMAVDSNASITISGGVIKITAYGDGIDSNGSLDITGGDIQVWGPTNGANGSLDYSGSASITGGTVMAAGASGMQENFTTSEQGSILVEVGSQASGTEFTLYDSKGNLIASGTPTVNYAVVIISTPSMVKGETYTLTAGTYSEEITLDSLIYGNGQGFGGFGGGGFTGGGPGGGGPGGGGPGGGISGGNSGNGFTGGGDSTGNGGFNGEAGGNPFGNFDGNFDGEFAGNFDPNSLPSDFNPDNLPEGFNPNSSSY